MIETLKIRPYARLLTMLGNQLITDERIALIELIKNSYDADATWVKVTFEKFGDNFEVLPESKIIIQDNGCGMTKDVLSTNFLNPATPGKKIQKDKNDKTAKGRIIQGEKGIGRFAMLKLGRKIDVISKTKNDTNEYILHYDFSNFDNDFFDPEISKPSNNSDNDKALFLDELNVELEERRPILFTNREITLGAHKDYQDNFGTIIEISKLNEGWTENKVKRVASDIVKLQSIFDKIIDSKEDISILDNDSFFVYLYKNDKYLRYTEDYVVTLENLIENRAVFRIENGFFDDKKLLFSFNLNGISKKIYLTDPDIKGIFLAKKYFKEITDENGMLVRTPECGSFSFSFYIFDFAPKAPEKYRLDKNDKEKIKQHRIYLYRDGIRVYPYGDAEDDWLQIDTLRGTQSAGVVLSNDQVIGVVKITHANNPRLKDKTNREGLIDEGFATSDFKKLLQIFLIYIRNKPYRQYQIDNERREIQKIIKEKQIETNILLFKNLIKENKEATEKFNEIEKEINAERKFLIRRAETTENLAGVGLSVETASHDIMQMMGLVLTNLDNLIREVMINSERIDSASLLKELNSMRGGLGFIHAQLKDIQLLFTSSKQRKRCINVKEIIDKVVAIYKNITKKEHIEVEVKNLSNNPLIAITTDAVLLQVLLNLFDNSIYWLEAIDIKSKKILITLDGEKCRLIFSDNGQGVAEGDLPYIFEPFYSGKGEEGRGLGLYIARQLLERYDYSIEYAELADEKNLPGANFIVSFISAGK